jgi:predicted  nucleic acid-binding Zn-ribbon protein
MVARVRCVIKVAQAHVVQTPVEARPVACHEPARLPVTRAYDREAVSAEADIASVAGQLAALTQTVEEMERKFAALRERADRQQTRSEVQQERIDLAARELAEVSARLQAAANALRESI